MSSPKFPVSSVSSVIRFWWSSPRILSGIWYGSVPIFRSSSSLLGCRSVPRFRSNSILWSKSSDWINLGSWPVGDADWVFPPLRRESRRVSWSNSEGQDSEGEDGRKISERDRVKSVLWQVRQHMRHDAGMTNYFFNTPRQTTWATRVRVMSGCTRAMCSLMRCTCTYVSC